MEIYFSTVEVIAVERMSSVEGVYYDLWQIPVKIRGNRQFSFIYITQKLERERDLDVTGLSCSVLIVSSAFICA